MSKPAHTHQPEANAPHATSKSHKGATLPDIAALQQDIASLTDALQRERADTVNMRRQYDEHLASLRTVVKANVIRELLPMIDNLERALKHIPKELVDHAYIKGIEGVAKQIDKTLHELDIERIATVGQPFDPRFHEAVSLDDSGGAHEVVSEEMQAGYKLGDEVIRPAMVRVKTVK